MRKRKTKTKTNEGDENPTQSCAGMCADFKNTKRRRDRKSLAVCGVQAASVVHCKQCDSTPLASVLTDRVRRPGSAR